jgi:hypothetical protein
MTFKLTVCDAGLCSIKIAFSKSILDFCFLQALNLSLASFDFGSRAIAFLKSAIASAYFSRAKCATPFL